MTLKIGSACSGYGGLDHGVARVFNAEPAWFCEFAEDPSKILAHHYPNRPNHRDLTAVDWANVEPVDIFTAGWPCQPWSLSGLKKGADDGRAIWPAIAHAVRSLQPRYVVLENVAAIVGVGELARAVGDLAEAGYDSSWCCVRASDAGAPHRRERCFILAANSEVRSGDLQRSASVGDGHFTARGRGSGEFGWGIYESRIRGWEDILGRVAPRATEPSERSGRERLSPEFVEFLMGLPAGWVTGVPGLSRRGQLKALGNGVVPQQAEFALRLLLSDWVGVA